ncbi:MAG: hypothetical protein Q4E88_03635 [Coriobacteriia bacterium]|nr:hypothetical protein [Coriobacteriia bacterium]
MKTIHNFKLKFFVVIAILLMSLLSVGQAFAETQNDENFPFGRFSYEWNNTSKSLSIEGNPFNFVQMNEGDMDYILHDLSVKKYDCKSIVIKNITRICNDTLSGFDELEEIEIGQSPLGPALLEKHAIFDNRSLSSISGLGLQFSNDNEQICNNPLLDHITLRFNDSDTAESHFGNLNALNNHICNNGVDCYSNNNPVFTKLNVDSEDFILKAYNVKADKDNNFGVWIKSDVFKFLSIDSGEELLINGESVDRPLYAIDILDSQSHYQFKIETVKKIILTNVKGLGYCAISNIENLKHIVMDNKVTSFDTDCINSNSNLIDIHYSLNDDSRVEVFIKNLDKFNKWFNNNGSNLAMKKYHTTKLLIRGSKKTKTYACFKGFEWGLYKFDIKYIAEESKIEITGVAEYNDVTQHDIEYILNAYGFNRANCVSKISMKNINEICKYAIDNYHGLKTIIIYSNDIKYHKFCIYQNSDLTEFYINDESLAKKAEIGNLLDDYFGLNGTGHIQEIGRDKYQSATLILQNRKFSCLSNQYSGRGKWTETI